MPLIQAVRRSRGDIPPDSVAGGVGVGCYFEDVRGVIWMR